MDGETFGLIKPDGIKRRITPSIIAFIMKNGFSITEARWVVLTQEEASKLCPYDINWLEAVGNKVVKNCMEGGIDPRVHFGNDHDTITLGKMVWQWNVLYLTEEPMCFLKIRGVNGNTPQEFKNFVGQTNEWSENTVRGLFREPGENIIKATKEFRAYRNVIHVPDPERIDFEKAIILGAETPHIIKPD